MQRDMSLDEPLILNPLVYDFRQSSLLPYVNTKLAKESQNEKGTRAQAGHTLKRKSLARIHPRVSIDMEVEVVVGVLYGTDLVVFVDEISEVDAALVLPQ